MKTSIFLALLLCLSWIFFFEATNAQSPQPAATSPTMYMITNELQCATSPSGPWITVSSNVVQVFVVPGTKFFRAKIFSGDGGLP